MTDGTLNVLFICTANAGRSQMAEAILTSQGGGRVRGHSAGVAPAEALHPQAEEVLREMGHDTGQLAPKPLSVFEAPDAVQMDFVFTLCDQAAGEVCPAWPGQPVTAHWGLPDPSKAGGTAAEQALAFRQCYRVLDRRIGAILALPLASLDRLSLRRRMAEIGEGAADEVAPA
ncbi:MAG: arsenate reductase ArsC [Pseudomonadota bacterium]